MYTSQHKTTAEGFDIELSIMDEDMPPDWDFESEDERQQLFEKINTGETLYFIAKVTASKHGIELGTDYLGGCCYNRMSEFLNDPYFAQMIDNAIAEAQDNIKQLTGA